MGFFCVINFKKVDRDDVGKAGKGTIVYVCNNISDNRDLFCRCSTSLNDTINSSKDEM